MGFLARLLGHSEPLTLTTAGTLELAEPRGRHAEVVIDPSFFGGVELTPWTGTGRVERAAAIQVPAVKRARDLICGTLGGLPVDVYGPAGDKIEWIVLDQPELGIAPSVTWARTFEDLFFEGVAWWRITATGPGRYPVAVQRLNPRSVTVKRRQVFWTHGDNTGSTIEWIPDDQLVRFDAPNDGLLIAGARAIRAALDLDMAAGRYAAGAPPVDYFTPAEGADPADDTEIAEILDAWQAARNKRATAYVPAMLKYNLNGFSPEQLQLADARQHAVLEIARAAGIDPEDLGVSTTTRTYQNAQDRRKSFIDSTLSPYIRAVEGRLSMPDMTPRGYTVRINLSEFLRSDDLTRVQVAQAAITAGVMTEAEGRAYFDPTLPVNPREGSNA